jgi:hypothetical protein
MMLFSWAAAAVILAANVVEVRSDAGCPSTEEVVDKLAPLLPTAIPTGSTTKVGDRAVVELLESGEEGVARLRVTLVREDGSVAGDRRLVLDGACPEKADAVAAVIAAWATDLVATGSIATSMPRAAGPTDVHSENAARQPPPGLSAVVGVAGGLAWVGGTAAIGTLEVLVGRAMSRWQVRIAATSETTRRHELATGEFTWSHTAAATGLMLRSQGRTWRFAADGGPFIGWTTLDGHGFSTGRQTRTFDFGATGALRLERAFAGFSLWIEGRGWGWPRTQRAVLSGSSERVKLSGFDAMLSLGGSIDLFR